MNERSFTIAEPGTSTTVDPMALTPERGRSTTPSEKPLSNRGFRGLLMAQLLGAFNDNLFKMIVSLLAVEAANVGRSGGYLSLASALFIVPYLIFSGYAGYLADRFDKRQVLVATKAAEIAIMILAACALLVGHIVPLLFVLFLLATQATFFSPAKYGILPEMLSATALPRANGALEMSRYLAVILGTVTGGLVLTLWPNQPAIIGLILLGVAAVGLASSMRISPARRSGAEKPFRINPWAEIATGVSRVLKDPRLTAVVAGITFFEFLGALMLLDLILVGKEVMALDDAHIGLFGAFIGCGVGLGSLAAGRFSRGKIDLGMALFGAIGVGAGLIVVSMSTGSYAWMAALLMLVGIFGGLLIVPLNATLQLTADRTERGHLISTNNFINMLAVFLSSAALWLLRDEVGMTSVQILFLCGLITLGAVLCTLRWSPGCTASLLRWARETSTLVRGRSSLGATCVVVGCAILASAANAESKTTTNIPSGSYSYAIVHPDYGNIGIFTQTIRRDRGDITVETELSIDVRLFSLISVHRRQSHRFEVWRDGRLLSYRSRTSINGAETIVTGYAEGNRFLIVTRRGIIEAPPTIRPSHPWSIAITKASLVLAAESGTVVPIAIEELGEQIVSIGDRDVRARHYRIRADGEYQLWYDSNDVPVKFAILERGANIDFTLK